MAKNLKNKCYFPRTDITEFFTIILASFDHFRHAEWGTGPSVYHIFVSFAPRHRYRSLAKGRKRSLSKAHQKPSKVLFLLIRNGHANINSPFAELSTPPLTRAINPPAMMPAGGQMQFPSSFPHSWFCD